MKMLCLIEKLNIFYLNISHHLLTFRKINENENALFDRETNFYQGQHFKASRS